MLVATCSVAGSSPVYEFLPKAKIAEQKAKHCALFHVWATWCTPCINELPKLLGYLAKHKEITPVIIDISSTYVQDNFSKKWLTQLAPPFTTYLKPKGDDKPYLAAIDATWPNRLPYNALFDKGKRKGRWIGSQDPEKLGQELTQLCR